MTYDNNTIVLASDGGNKQEPVKVDRTPTHQQRELDKYKKRIEAEKQEKAKADREAQDKIQAERLKLQVEEKKKYQSKGFNVPSSTDDSNFYDLQKLEKLRADADKRNWNLSYQEKHQIRLIEERLKRRGVKL
jgi:hypothetical protein